MRTLAEPAFTLPAGIAPSDLAFISQYVAIIAAVFAVIGILLLKRFAGRSVGFMVAIVVGVCPGCVPLGCAVVVGRRMEHVCAEQRSTRGARIAAIRHNRAAGR